MCERGKSPEYQRRNVGHIELGREARGRSETGKPICCVRFGGSARDALTYQGIHADAPGRHSRVCAIPYKGRMLLASCPPFEPIAVRCAFLKELLGLRKIDRVAPDASQALVRLLDEVLEIALPAPAVVGQEQQLVGPRQKHPSGEVNRADFIQLAWPENLGNEPPNRREHKTQRQLSDDTPLHCRDAEEMVLRGVIFSPHDFVHAGAFWGLVVWRVAFLAPAKQPIQSPGCG